MSLLQINCTRLVRKRRLLALRLAAIFLSCVILVTLKYSDIIIKDPAFRSKPMERGLLKVMEYIERERDVDGVLRDAFVDKIWRSLKMSLVRDLARKMEESNNSYTGSYGQGDKEMAMMEKFLVNNRDFLERLDLDGLMTGQLDKKASITTDPGGERNSNKSDNSFQKGVNTRRFIQSIPEEKRVMNFSHLFSRRIVTSLEFSYNYDQSYACYTHPIDVLIAIPSAPGNFRRRERVRNSTTARFAKNPKHRVKLLFFIGAPWLNANDPRLSPSSSVSSYLNLSDNYSREKYIKLTQDAIDSEQIKHGDIVQATYFDTYQNISKKAALILNWSTKYCSKSTYVVRMDDDVTGLNISEIIATMKETSIQHKHFILGKMKVEWLPMREKMSKYFTSYEDYPYKELPPFLLGGAMGYPLQTAGLLLAAMRRVVTFWLDDVFVTGICARHVRVPIFNSTAFSFQHFSHDF